MTESEALNILGIPAGTTTEEVEELIGELVFKIRHEALMHAGVPLWLQARINRLNAISEAAAILGFSENAEVGSTDAELDDTAGPAHFLRSAEKVFSRIRLRVSQSDSPRDLSQALIIWHQALLKYAELFTAVMQPWLTESFPAARQQHVLDSALAIQLINAEPDAPILREMLSSEWGRVRLWRNTHS
ncbi:MAG: hypothetical protein ACK500_07860 [Flavobacteriales bacterium]